MATADGPAGLNDGDEDYDGGLRAAAEGGRVAVFRGAGRPAQQQQAPEVDSPFLGLFDEPSRRARPEPPPASRSTAASSRRFPACPCPARRRATPEDLRPAARNGFDLRQPLERTPYNGSVRSNGGGAPLVAVPVDEDAPAAAFRPRPRRYAGPAEPPARRTAEPPVRRPEPRTAGSPDSRRSRAKKTPLDRTPKPKRSKDRDPSIDLEITEIAGHLTFTPNSVTAWYWLPEVRWAFRPDAEREALLSAISEQYAGLAGFRLHLRRTTRPFPADQWARVVDAQHAVPAAVVPARPVVGGSPGRRAEAPAVDQPRRGPDLPRHHLRPAHPRRHLRRADRQHVPPRRRRRRAQADGPHRRAVRRGPRRVRHARPAGHRGRAGMAALPVGRAVHVAAARTVHRHSTASGTAATCSP